MRIVIILGLLLNCIITISAQKNSKNWRVGTLTYLDYSLYRWDQRPSTASFPERKTPYSLGQLMNVVPGVYVGAWFGDQRWALVSLEGGITYFPFSIDLSSQHEPKSWGTLGLPALLKINWLLDSSYRQKGRRVAFKSFIYAAYGREWVLAGLTQPKGSPKTLLHQLQIVELGTGNTTNGFSLMTFFRFGWGSARAFMANIGIKIGWDTF